MGSYYRDPLPLNPQHHQSTFHAQDPQHPPAPPAPSQRDADLSQGPTRLCSVRGCTAILPFEYSLRMCEQCRGRHRIYANTKRQKRKLEKLALGGQRGPVVWMPPNDGQDDPTPSPDLPPPMGPHQEEAESPPPTMPSEPPASVIAAPEPLQQFIQAPQSPWDNSAIDPRLFSQTPASSSSELAGALHFPVMNPTTPPQAARTTEHASQSEPVRDQNAASSPAAISPRAARHMAQPVLQCDSFQSLQRPESQSGPSQAQASPQPSFGSDPAAQTPDPMLPHRYCSIKGCKSIIAGDSFFKMCEPCRDRYRNYGTTKRAKWRREKEAAVAELQNLRMEEDKRRAENGLPPLPREEIEWQDIPDGALGSASHATRLPFAQVVPSHAPRMCTVSHCREILPAEYEYLRCERHRIQNRHHSKLKRVRDKESKALAFDDWAAAVDAMSQKNEDPEDEDDEDEGEQEDDGVDTTEGGPEGTGMPPAARGTRRTNHVCSIKVCNNLLSPSNPWKMCDSCRSRDRTARKIKALRESGVPEEPIPLKMMTPSVEEKKVKKRKKKADEAGGEGGAGQPEVGSSEGEGPGPVTADAIVRSLLSVQSVQTDMPFMNPLLPDGPGPLAKSPTSGISSGTAHPQAAAAVDSISTQATQHPISNEGIHANGKSSRKKKSLKKKDKGISAEPPFGVPAIVSAPVIGGSSAALQSPAPHIQPAYHVPYYMPPPFAIPPYASGRMGAPPMYGRDPYAPSPMSYHPPYPFPYPYPPPPGYGFPPPPYPMPMPLPPPMQLPPASASAPEQLPSPEDQPEPSTATAPVLSQPPPPPPPTQAATFKPFVQTLDVSTMYSTFSSRSKDDTASPSSSSGTRDNQTLYGSEVAAPPPAEASATGLGSGEPLKLTFNAKTGQTYVRPEPVPGLGVLKMKRTLDETPGGDGTSPKRRGVLGADGGVQAAPASAEQLEGGEADPPKSLCGNKTCHRSLPANATGSLCEKCKEKVRKKQAKAKQRFKLEPKKSSIVVRPHSSTSNEAAVSDCGP